MADTSPSFVDCLVAVWSHETMMSEYRRLTGSSIGLDSRHPIDRLVDGAVGFRPALATADEVGHFLGFVWDAVWSRL